MCSSDLDEHRRVVKEVLRRLQEHDLFCKPEKCEFEQQKVKYLGAIISENQVEMDPVKVWGIAGLLAAAFLRRSQWPMSSSKKSGDFRARRARSLRATVQ